MWAGNEFQNLRWRFKQTADERRDKATRGRSRMGTREMIQFAVEPIRSGGRVNDSPYQTAMVVRTLITSSGVRPGAE